MWLTITLAVFRYIAVTFPAKVLEYCSMKRAVMAIASSFFFTAIICTPSYLSVQVSEVTDKELLELVDWREEGNFTAMYRIEESDLSKNNKNIPRIISFYAFSVLAKLVPCFVLTWLSIQLVRALLQAERRRFNLKNPTGLRLVPTVRIRPEMKQLIIVLPLIAHFGENRTYACYSTIVSVPLFHGTLQSSAFTRKLRKKEKQNASSHVCLFRLVDWLILKR